MVYSGVKGVASMEYELVHEIKNLCRNNQMRDIFFEELECDDPVLASTSTHRSGDAAASN